MTRRRGQLYRAGGRGNGLDARKGQDGREYEVEEPYWASQLEIRCGNRRVLLCIHYEYGHDIIVFMTCTLANSVY